MSLCQGFSLLLGQRPPRYARSDGEGCHCIHFPASLRSHTVAVAISSLTTKHCFKKTINRELKFYPGIATAKDASR